MENPNAFIGKKTAPTAREVAATLAQAAAPWNELIAWLEGQGIACSQWHSVSPKYGWALIPSVGKRRIVYLGPCDGCFRTSFVLGDRAVAAAAQSDLPANVLQQIAVAPHYAEGTGLRLLVRSRQDLDAVRKLVAIKMQN